MEASSLKYNIDGSITEAQRIALEKCPDNTRYWCYVDNEGNIFKSKEGFYFILAEHQAKYFTNYWFAYAYSLRIKHGRLSDEV